LRNLHYIAIEGTIGVGKTSLANLLSERLKAKLVLEEFEGNPFFYQIFMKTPKDMHFKLSFGF
jgi:deoxyadenosine/deoxycytidine kinase